MNSIRRRRTMLMTAQSYDCIVALYLHNIFLFTSLLVEFYFSIWKSCIWWGKNLFFFYSIYFVYFVCMHEDQTMTDIVLILILCMYMKWKWNQILKMCMHWFSSDIYICTMNDNKNQTTAHNVSIVINVSLRNLSLVESAVCLFLIGSRNMWRISFSYR